MATGYLAIGYNGQGTVTPSSNVTIGVPFSITALPANHYVAGATVWAVGAGDITIADPTALSTYATMNSGSAGSINADFEKATYALTVQSDGHGTVTGSGTVTDGNATAITATPIGSYVFSYWSYSGSGVTIASPTSASTTVVLTAGDATLIAHFKGNLNALPDINNLVCGVVKSYLIFDSAITDMVMPAKVPFTSIGEFVERIDTADPGVVDIDNVQLELMEDYTNHAEGFWWKLINGYSTYVIEIMFSIMEGDNETFFFRGSINRQASKFSEVYQNGDDKVRDVSIQLVSMIGSLDTVTNTALNTELRLHTSLDDYGLFRLTSLQNIIASIIKLAFNESFDATLCVNNSSDIELGVFGAWATWDQCGVMIQHCIGGVWSDVGFFLSSDPLCWLNRFGTAKDLLSMLCQTFGVVAKYTYGTVAGLIDPNPALNAHRLFFNSRGNSIYGQIEMEKPVPTVSEFLPDTVAKSRLIRVTQGTNQEWYLNGLFQQGTPPPLAKFDVDVLVDFVVTYPSTSGFYGLYLNISGAWDLDSANYVRFWDYATGVGAYVNIETDGDDNLAIALCQYLFNRLSPSRFQYTREYGGIKASDGATTSQRNLQTLRGHQISDIINGASVVGNYYATEVHKDIMTNTAQIIWTKE
jgi:hypothetical protein